MLFCTILLLSCSDDNFPENSFNFNIDDTDFDIQNMNMVYHEPTDRLVIEANKSEEEFVELRFEDVSNTTLGTTSLNLTDPISCYKDNTFYANILNFLNTDYGAMQITQFDSDAGFIEGEFSDITLGSIVASPIQVDGSFSASFKNNISDISDSAEYIEDGVEIVLDEYKIGYIGNNGQLFLSFSKDESFRISFQFPRTITEGKYPARPIAYPNLEPENEVTFTLLNELFSVEESFGFLTVKRHDKEKREIEIEIQLDYYDSNNYRSTTGTFSVFYF